MDDVKAWWGKRRDDGTYERTAEIVHEDGLRQEVAFRLTRVSAEAVKRWRAYGRDFGTSPAWSVSVRYPSGEYRPALLSGDTAADNVCLTMGDAAGRAQRYMRRLAKERAAQLARERELAEARALLARIDSPEALLAERRAVAAEAEARWEQAGLVLREARERVREIERALALVAATEAA